MPVETVAVQLTIDTSVLDRRMRLLAAIIEAIQAAQDWEQAMKQVKQDWEQAMKQVKQDWEQAMKQVNKMIADFETEITEKMRNEQALKDGE